MRKVILSCTLLLSSFSFAAKSTSAIESSVTPMLGFNQGQFVLGLDYERALSAHVSFGGYFAFTAEKKEALLPQIIALGMDAKVHVGVEKWDLYVRPGFGLAFASLDTISKTYLAPILGIGVQYALSEKTSLGVENLNVFNWTEKTDFSSEALVATVRIKF